MRSSVLSICSFYRPRLRPSQEDGSEEPDWSLRKESLSPFMGKKCKSSIANNDIRVYIGLRFVFQF